MDIHDTTFHSRTGVSFSLSPSHHHHSDGGARQGGTGTRTKIRAFRIRRVAWPVRFRRRCIVSFSHYRRVPSQAYITYSMLLGNFGWELR